MVRQPAPIILQCLTHALREYQIVFMITLRKEEEEAVSADDGFADFSFQADLQ